VDRAKSQARTCPKGEGENNRERTAVGQTQMLVALWHKGESGSWAKTNGVQTEQGGKSRKKRQFSWGQYKDLTLEINTKPPKLPDWYAKDTRFGGYPLKTRVEEGG